MRCVENKATPGLRQQPQSRVAASVKCGSRDTEPDLVRRVYRCRASGDKGREDPGLSGRG